MLRGIYTSTSAMLELQARQTALTNNMANINTVGYKAENLYSKSFDEIMLSNKDKYVGGEAKTQKLGGLSLGVRIDETLTDYSQGDISFTGNNTDFALLSDGFFAVEGRDGNEFYTRAGVFKVDVDGTLVTTAGYKVLGRNLNTNNVEPIMVGNSNVGFDSENNILLDGQPAYKFKIVGFEDTLSLERSSENVFTGKDAMEINQYSVKQGYKEASNVDLIKSTIDLTTNLRAFEANQSVVKALDSTLNLIANDIGAVR